MKKLEQKIKLINYFEGFNALRFLAAMLVVFHHGEQIRFTNGLSTLKDYTLFHNGGLAVDFFFVLSGFLITYLLLKEKKNTQDISIKKFYIRRIFRIWPLYYLLVFLGLLIVPFVLNISGQDYNLPFDSMTAWLLYIFFLPNVVSSIYTPAGNLIYALWSIGVEEQFYLIWAPLLKYLGKYLLYILIFVIGFKFLLNQLLWILSQSDESWTFYYKFIKTIKFELMSVGGIGALYVFRFGKSNLEGSLIFTKWFQIVWYSILLIHLCFRNYIFEMENNFSAAYMFFFNSKLSSLLLGVLFLWLLLNTSLNKNALFKFRSSTLNKLGEISYGIYMYHIIIIYTIISLTKKWLTQNIYVSELIFYSLVIPSVLLCSYLSFHLFEKRIISLKSMIN